MHTVHEASDPICEEITALCLEPRRKTACLTSLTLANLHLRKATFSGLKM